MSCRVLAPEPTGMAREGKYPLDAGGECEEGTL
jgi:hypothetical protein